MGKLLPEPKAQENKYADWAIDKLNRYGTLMLLLSWLPIVGDLLCGLAGWLRLPILQSTICIFIGKFARYIVLLVGVYPIVKYIM